MNISDTATARATAKELSELRPPFRDLAFTCSGWPTTFSTSSENERLSRASLAKPITFSISARSGDEAGRSRWAALRISSDRCEPEHPDVLSEEVVVAARADQLEQVQRLGGDPLGERGVGRLHLRLDRVLHELPLGRVVGVVVHLDRARLQPGLELLGQVLGDDQRAQHLAVLHLLDGRGPAVHDHRVDGVEQPLALGGDVDPLPAQLDRARGRGERVVEGHLGLVRRLREREPDQHGDHHRVEHQQAHQQRRAPQDAQILRQQPAHQCPRWWRNWTKAASKSSPWPPTTSSSSRGDPSKSRSPSARTTSWPA